jgi:hypothetical protein
MSKLTRVTITLPRDVLAAADARAKRLDRSRSWVVAEVLRRSLNQSLVSEPVVPYEASRRLDAYRRTQLESDLALSPKQRVLEAERTAREARLLRGLTPGAASVHFFDRYEDYLAWKLHEDR